MTYFRSLILLFSFCLCTALSAQKDIESFEGWDGQTNDWLPDGWTEIHTDDVIPTMKNGEFTWHVIDPTKSKTLPKATDGNYYVAIGYAKDENNKDLYQDEWLITPAYHLSEYGGTLNYDVAYSPLFLFLLDDDHVDFNEMDFKVRESSADLQVLVRIMDENGEWPDLWDFKSSLFDDWQGQIFASLWNSFFNTEFRSSSTVFFTEEQYKDATIQVAFRYAGDRGNIMGLDKVMFNYATRVDNTTGLSNLSGSTSRSAASYDLQGRRLSSAQAHSQSGLVLKVAADGSIRKQIVK